MFKCDSCKCTTKSGDKENKVIVQTRPRTYEYKKVIIENERKKVLHKESKGSEIVKETKMCCNCIDEFINLTKQEE